MPPSFSWFLTLSLGLHGFSMDLVMLQQLDLHQCVRGAAQDKRCLGECQSSSLDLFLFQLRIYPLVRDLFLRDFIFSDIRVLFFSHLRYSLWYQSFSSFSMSQVYFIVFPNSTSSRAALGEGVLQYWCNTPSPRAAREDVLR